MSSSTTDAAPNPVGGALLVLVIVLTFALNDAATKYLIGRYPVEVVVAGRFLASFLLLFVIFAPRLRLRLWRMSRPLPVIARSCAMIMGSLFMGLSLQRMPLGETVAITYAAPLAVMLLAAPILGEKIHYSGWIMALLGFVGVVVIARPGGGLDPWGVIFCLINVACFVAYQLMTRTLVQTESTIVMITNLSLVGAVVFSVMAAPSIGAIHFEALDIAMIVGLGATATLGHFLYSIAYRMAPASIVAPMGYFHLVWAELLGLLLFGHLPDPLTLAGMAMILLAGVGIVLIAYIRRAEVP